MTTTIGQLISTLYDRFQTVYGDDKLAAFATQVKVQEVLVRNGRTRTRARKTV
jgi:hypothetical protein